jgi:glycosyltransferase involved in cell wall biosynthesis
MFLTKSLPKISCLLVTANGRYNLAKKSIECYIAQTYQNKELIIVNEGNQGYQKQLQHYIDSLERKDIRPTWLNGLGQYTLGGLRNISIALADGDYFVQWDDDDFCLPQRLSTQYAFLAKNPKAKVCYLSDQLHFFWTTSALYWNNWKKFHSGNGLTRYSLIPGTGMFSRDIPWRYPSHGKNCRAGEDSVFSNKILDDNPENIVLLEGMGNMHCYTYHGNQVYDIEHHMNISRMRTNDRNFINKNRGRIEDSIKYFEFSGDIKVMCRDGVAFIYNAEAKC